MICHNQCKLVSADDGRSLKDSYNNVLYLFTMIEFMALSLLFSLGHGPITGDSLPSKLFRELIRWQHIDVNAYCNNFLLCINL